MIKFSTSPFLYKINYLIKHNANIFIIFAFLKFQITKIFFNHFRSKEKRKNKMAIKDKRITHDFFSMNSYDWKKNLKEYLGKDTKYLEVGSFEGISAYFIHKYLKPKKMYCVDTWKGSNEHGPETIFTTVESNFDNNLKDIKNLIKYKNTSDDFFSNNKLIFDIVYIDGLHKYYQVKKDLINALKFLDRDGIIICDDYFWNLDADKKDIPIGAINEIVNKNNLKIVAVTVNQIFLKKSFKKN